MTDPLGIGSSVASGTGQITQAAPAAPIAEFVTPLPATALGAAMLHATVIGSTADGTTQLRTAVGTLTVQTGVTLSPGSSLDLKLLGGSPPTAMLLNIHDGAAPAGSTTASPTAAAAASTLLDLGTTVDATVSGPPSGNPIVPSSVAQTVAPNVAANAGTLPPAQGTTPAIPVAPSPASAAPPATPANAAPSANPAPAANPGETPSAAQPASLSASTINAAPNPGPPPASITAPPPGAPPAATLPAAAPAPLAVGSQLVLRVVAPPAEPSDTIMLGQVVAAAGQETIVDTPVGMLVLGRRLGLQPGDILAFEPLSTSPPPTSDTAPPRPTRSGGWPALDLALEALDASAPALAAQMRAELTPATSAQLGPALMLLMGALYGGAWPGEDVERALTLSGHDKLRQRLIEDTAELRQLKDDPITGDWRVLTLPLLESGMVQPVRVYTRRRKKPQGEAQDQSGRFIVEVEMSKLGPLQLDGLLRTQRFDLVLRSHRPLADGIRAEATAIFHRSIAATGIAGDIAFSTVSRFDVTPLAALRAHVTVNV